VGEGTPQKEIPSFQVENPTHGQSYTIDPNREGIFDPSPPAKKKTRNGGQQYYIQTNPVVATQPDLVPERLENLKRPSGREVPPKPELPEAI